MARLFQRKRHCKICHITYIKKITYNAPYNVVSPAVYGYTPDVAVVGGRMGAKDLKVVVNYMPNPHTVTWINDGEKDVDNYVYGDEIVKPADPEKEGYTFTGWSEDGENVIEPEKTVPDEDIEYIAVWKINRYKILYFIKIMKITCKNIFCYIIIIFI